MDKKKRDLLKFHPITPPVTDRLHGLDAIVLALNFDYDTVLGWREVKLVCE